MGPSRIDHLGAPPSPDDLLAVHGDGTTGTGASPDVPLATAVARALVANVTGVVRGQPHAVGLATVAILAGGHVLVEDVPGTGKTTIARSFAASLGRTFSRVQATADLMPADITGSSMWNPSTGSFTFVPGPVFASVLLVDELNRMPPRSQSALLEAMEERRVTVDGVSHPLPDGFVVIATQNPLDQHGTYPLPEGTLDRFAVRVGLEPLAIDDEVGVVTEQLVSPTVDALRPVVDAADLERTLAAVRATHVAPPVAAYAVQVVRATREHPGLRAGAGTRAAITLVRCAQARAVLHGRAFVTPDDVKALAVPVLAHRLQSDAAYGGGSDTAALAAQVVASVPVLVQEPGAHGRPAR